jgi:hypothetical protein
MEVPEVPQGYKNLRNNFEYLSVTGLILELLGWLCWIAIITFFATRGVFPYNAILLFVIGVICVIVGKILHYLRKNSILTYEVLKHLKEKDKK